MRRVLSAIGTAGVLAFTATATAAVAADIPRPAPAYQAPVTYAPVFMWTGGYIGISGGWGWGSSDWNNYLSSADPDGGLVGLTLGYNWQTGPWVWGLEGDISWSDIRGGFINAACPTGCQTKNTWLGTVRGRAGYAMGRVMPYVTGGLAIGDIRATELGFVGVRETNAGWTIGAGIEASIAPNWTAKIEYLYVDLGDVGCGVGACAFPTNVDFQANIVRGGVSYKF